MRTAVFCALLFFLAVAPACARAAERLSLEERKQVYELVRAFRKAREDPGTRRQAADKLLDFGPEAAERLLKEVEKTLRSDWRAYERQLNRQTHRMFKKQWTKSAAREVEKLRATLEGLRANPTKDKAASQGVPALQKLETILLVDPQKALEASEELQALRARLEEFAAYEKRCEDLLPEEDRKREKGRSRRNNARETDAPEAPPVQAPTFADRLARIEAVAAVRPMLQGEEAVLEANGELADEIGRLEAAGILHLNVMRLLSGLKPLSIDPKLCAAARDHCRDMATKNFFSHTSPLPGKQSFTQRAKNFGATARAENIAYGKTSASDTNMGWFHSPGHHKNMLNPKWKCMGLGHFQTRWCQMFR